MTSSIIGAILPLHQRSKQDQSDQDSAKTNWPLSALITKISAVRKPV
jgi:hypothetical protein